jgi:hypothetical protein
MNGRIRQLIAGVAAPVFLLGSVSCGDVARTGRSPSMLVMDSLAGSSGAKPGTFSAFLNSDVVTLVKVAGSEQPVATIFNDPGQVTLRVLLKDPGNIPNFQQAPSQLNFITISRYHVTFIRSDGRNIQGVDVPFAFDGAATATVGQSPTDIGFELVRHQAKDEAPLRALANGGGRLFISTIAQVTFYGSDLAGNEVSVTGTMSVDFADFGDPG